MHPCRQVPDTNFETSHCSPNSLLNRRFVNVFKATALVAKTNNSTAVASDRDRGSRYDLNCMRQLPQYRTPGSCPCATVLQPRNFHIATVNLTLRLNGIA